MTEPPIRVVVPWWPGGCGYRIRNWAWLRQRFEWPLVPGLRGEPWIKALAIMPAVADAPEGSIIVVHDADVFCDGDGLVDAVGAVRWGQAEWAIPHRLVHRLTDAGTLDFMRCRAPLEREEDPYVGIEGGGVVVARRETLLDCPPDPRFVGWGAEDDCWGIALRWLHGAPWCGGQNLWHLWHPPQQRSSRTRGSSESTQLRLRYYRARHSQAAMRALVAEAQDALTAAHPDRARHTAPAV